MRIIVAGSRDFTNRTLLFERLDFFNSEGRITEVVSGTARGADRLGEEWAEARKIEVARFIPDWDKYGRSAGIRRNKEMGVYADGLVAFWDGASRGTKHMIEFMKEQDKPVRIVKYE